MAGLTVTVDSVNITAYVDVYSIVLEDIATHLVGTARFDARDHSGTIGLDAKDSVSIADDGTTLFSGEVVEVGTTADGVAKEWHVVCQDNNILLAETVIEDESYAAATSDSDIIDDLFSNYRSDIDSTTYVSTIDASMEAMAFRGMTLQEILDEIGQRTGGRYYVDADKNLHYYTTEANNASFGLSTSPDGSTTFGFGGFRKTETAARLANKVFVLGKDVSGWTEDASSISTYGERHGTSRDNRITTSQGVTDRGTQLLDRYDLPRTTYECWTEKDGLAAGQSLTVVHETLGINTSFYIRKITTRIMSADADTVRRHYLILDDEPIVAEIHRRNVNQRVMSLETVITDINETVYDTDAPSAPTLVGGNLSTGVDIDADGHQVVYIQITWGSVADADLDHYTVQGSTSSDFSGYTMTRDHPADGDRIERFMPVVGNTTYYWRVRAVDWVGNTSAWSDTQNITSDTDSSAPAQVQGLSAAAGRTVIGLSWTANSEADLAEYQIERKSDELAVDWAVLAKARLNFYIDQDFDDSDVTDQVEFEYRVSAIDTSGNTGTASAEASAAVGQITGDHIAALTITAAHIAASTITADKLNVTELSAISADLGTCTAGTVTSATIRTAASGARVVLDSTNGIQAYNSTPTQTFSLQTSGAGWIGTDASIAWNTAGGVTIDGGLMVDGTIVATAISNTIGQTLFSNANGLLLFGPHSGLSSTEWKGSRGQSANITGALHTEQGKWLGTRGLVVEIGTTNYCTRPRMVDANDDGDADGWTLFETCNGAITTTVVDHPREERGYLQRTQYSGDVADSGETLNWLIETAAGSFASGNPATFTCDMMGEVDGITVSVVLRAYSAIDALLGSSSETVTLKAGTLQRVEVTYGTLPANTNYVRVLVSCTDIDSGDSIDMYFGAAQIEKRAVATSFAAGNLGSGYAWGGTADESTTTRTATEVEFDDQVGQLSGTNTLSFRLVVQVPYDSDATWARGSSYNYVFSTRGAAGNSIRCAYDEDDDKWTVYINGAEIFQSSAQTFSAGDWYELLLTCDFSNDEYYLYVNGEEDGSDTSSLAAPTLTDVEIGALTGGTSQGGFTFVEFAVLGSILTADEAAALYTWDKPMIDTGAIERPGIYLLDGLFRLASSSTGARTEIDVDGIKAYTSSAQSVAIDTDGDVKFGSDISAAATTALAVFANAQTYNSEAMGAGDVLLGDNSASKANILWDKSAGTLKFRGSTTTQLYINTDGSLVAGGGAIKVSSAANILFSVASANQGLAWFSDAFSTGAGYLRVETAGNNDMRLVTGDTAVAGYSDFYLQNESSDGTRTPLVVDASEKNIKIYGASGHTLSVRNNNDGDWSAGYFQVVSRDKAVIYLDQDNNGSPLLRCDGGNNSITASAGTIQEYILINVNGTDRKLAAYATS